MSVAAHASRAAWSVGTMRVSSSPPTDASPHPYTQLLSFSAGVQCVAVANGARVDFYGTNGAEAVEGEGPAAELSGEEDETDGDDERPGRLRLPFLGSLDAGSLDAGALVRAVHCFDNGSSQRALACVRDRAPEPCFREQVW